jgi:hypothetical protein
MNILKEELYFKSKNENKNTFCIKLQRPLYEPDNGATAWFTEDIGLGTPEQSVLKFMIDTGTKNSWITSTYCNTDAASSHSKFDTEKSTSFKFIHDKEEINFGAWGKMIIRQGNDVIHLPDKKNFPINIDVSLSYTGIQFMELIADGGIGIPAHTPKQTDNSTLLLNELKFRNIIDDAIVSFWYNRKKLEGEVMWGGINLEKINPKSINTVNLIDFPNDLECWLINLDSLNSVFPDGSTKNILTNVAFALDTGSSQFKGDENYINQCKAVITKDGLFPEKIISPQKITDYDYPTLELNINGKKYPLSPEKYFIQVSATEWHLAFQYLADCEHEFLVGTTFLESIYTAFDFDNRCIILAEPIL